MKRHVLLPSLCLALAAAALIAGCDSSNPIAPTGSIITLTANPTLIDLGSTEGALIIVTGFRPDGNPLNPGTQVNLRTTLGQLDSTIVTIGEAGRGTTRLRPDGRTGIATVTASLPRGGGGGGDMAGSSGTATVDIQIGETEETKQVLILNAEPAAINLNQTSQISVLVRNADGSVFAGSGNVRLRTTLGTIAPENAPISGGEARATLTPGGRPGTATVTATFGSSDEVMIDVVFGEDTGTRPTLLLTASPTSIGLNQTAEIDILARNPDGSRFTQGGSVRLRSSLGTIDGTVALDDQGEATATLTSGTQSGTATVTATLGTSDPVTVDVEIQVPVLTLNAQPTSINLGDGSSEDSRSNISVFVRNPDGTPIDGIAVRVRTTLGTISPQNPQTDANGEAGAVLVAGNRAGTATVTAQVASSDQVSVDVAFAADVPTLTLTATPDRINIEEHSIITVVARNSDGSPLSGAEVTLRTSLGTLGPTMDSEVIETTDVNGRTTAQLTPDGRSGTVTITGSVPASQEVTAQLTILQTVTIVEVSQNILDANEETLVTILIRDEDDLTLENSYSVELLASLGTFPLPGNGTNETTTDPRAQGASLTVTGGRAETIYKAGRRAGQDMIRARLANAQEAIADVTIRTTPAALTLEVDRATIPPGQRATIIATANVVDFDGLRLINEVVTFNVEGRQPGQNGDPLEITGTFNPSRSVATNFDGDAIVTITLESSALPDPGGRVIISARVRSVDEPDVQEITVEGGG